MSRLPTLLERTLLCLVLAATASCVDAQRTLLSGVESPPPQIRQSCALATTRCAHCHPIERVIMQRGIGAARWRMYVEQMRLKPSSGISVHDADEIFRCLSYIDEACTDCKRGPS